MAGIEEPKCILTTWDHKHGASREDQARLVNFEVDSTFEDIEYL